MKPVSFHLVVACLLTLITDLFAAPTTSAPAVTFTHDIAPILYKNCSDCHRPGEVAPFPLLTYDDAYKKAKTIAKVVGKRFMPPWKADPNFGEFHDARRLTDEQITLIQRWAEGGAVEGNAADLPPLPKFAEGWSLGEPDLVLEPKEAYTLGADGNDVFQCFVLPTGLTEDRYVSAVELRPGNSHIVHHIIAFIDTSGAARKLDEATPEPGYVTFGGPGFVGGEWLEGWAPGKITRLLPDGYGKRIPRGADIVLQVHYNRSGKAETDRSKLGIYFAKAPVAKRVRVHQLNGGPLRIPAGETNYVARGGMTVPDNVTVLEVFPHMHRVGREIQVSATLPDGHVQPMVRIPDWDFNWQLGYAFKEPLSLPRGTKIDLVAHYDNSDGNPNNPNHPPKFVHWGEQTKDEMLIAFFTYTVDSENLLVGKTADSIPRRAGRFNGQLLQQFIKEFDRDGDGKLNEEERAAALKAWQERRQAAGAPAANGQ